MRAMNERLLQFIQYKTGGRKSKFAEMLGWSPQYLNKLLNQEGGIGIRPVLSLLGTFPELDARWLLLGEGAMITTGAAEIKAHLLRLLELEKYMPVMSPDELRDIQLGKTDFDSGSYERWERSLACRDGEREGKHYNHQ